MNVTIQHTELLASTMTCVIIPGLGAVLAHIVDASIAADGSVRPPHRSFTFNVALTQSDGILENSVARALEIPFERARALIADEVEAMQYQLRKQGSLSLGRVGTLTWNDADGTVTFVPAEADMLTPLASWLQAVKADTFITRQDVVAEARNIARPVPVWRRVVRSAAVASAIIAVAVVASTPIVVNNVDSASTALPAVSAPQPAYVPGTSAPVLNLVADSLPMPVDTAARHAYQAERAALKSKPAETAKADRLTVAKPSQLTISDAHRYVVVVASVGNADEAAEFIARAKRNYGGEYGYVISDGRCRVYAATAPTSAQAAQAAAQLSSRFKGAWVCGR